MKPVIVLDNVSVRYRAPEQTFRTFKEYAIQLVKRKVRFKEFPLEINFSLGGGTTSTTGTGTAVVDSSLFVPNFFTNDLADLQDFSLSVTASPLRRRVPHSR